MTKTYQFQNATQFKKVCSALSENMLSFATDKELKALVLFANAETFKAVETFFQSFNIQYKQIS